MTYISIGSFTKKIGPLSSMMVCCISPPICLTGKNKQKKKTWLISLDTSEN